jgi:hypothetical protein
MMGRRRVVDQREAPSPAAYVKGSRVHVYDLDGRPRGLATVIDVDEQTGAHAVELDDGRVLPDRLLRHLRPCAERPACLS